MEGMFHSEKICPYCNQLISQELYNDHILCHELENEDNYNPSNNINNYQRNISNNEPNNNSFFSGLFSNSNSNSNHQNNENNNANNENNGNNNQNENIFSKVFNIISSPFQSQNNNEINPNNSSNINNNNNNNNQDPGFFNSLIGRNPYRNNDELNNNINNNRDMDNNNYNNNNIPSSEQEPNIFQTFSNSIASAFNNLGEIGNEIKNISNNINYNTLVRTGLLNNNPSRLMGNNQSNIVNNYNNHNNTNIIQNIRLPLPVHGPLIINNRNPLVEVFPPVIIGERGHVIDINNNRRINPNDLNRIMELLPSTILKEKKEGENNECVVCLSPFEVGDSITTLPCVHIFHTDCIKSWLESNNSCPICKFEITLNSIMREN